MSERTLVPIFFFWALLTLITPTLILLSENSKADLDANGNYTSEGMKARRMMSYTLDDIIRTLRPPQPPPAAKPMVAEEEQASSANLKAPELEPTPSSGNSTRATPRGSSHSLHHNHTLKINTTDDRFTLPSPKSHLQIK